MLESLEAHASGTGASPTDVLVLGAGVSGLPVSVYDDFTDLNQVLTQEQIESFVAVNKQFVRTLRIIDEGTQDERRGTLRMPSQS